MTIVLPLQRQVMEQPSLLVFETTEELTRAICQSIARLEVRVLRVHQRENLASVAERVEVVVVGPSLVQAGSLVELSVLLRHAFPGARLIAVTACSSERLAISALRAGFNEYVKYPIAYDALIEAVRTCLGNSALRQPAEARIEPSRSCELVGGSSAMRELRTRIGRLAASNAHILITGETGTGKELVARLLHQQSHRSHRPLVTLNCAAIPETLLESELFGYERGAFTGAFARNEGKLKAADGGSVLLDEIGEMNLGTQAKLLRLLEAKEIQRLGRNEGIQVDVRVLAATNQNLERMVEEGKFRKDFFYRLNVARIHLPALRDRKEDVVKLIDHYIRYFNHRLGRHVQGLSHEAMQCLLGYEWPGNVRELKNVLEGTFVELPPEEVPYPDLPLPIRRQMERVKEASGDERERLLWALSATNWNKSKAAGKLNWSRMTLYRKMAQYHIQERESLHYPVL